MEKEKSFQQIVLQKLDIYIQKKEEVETLLYTVDKNKLKIIIDLNIRSKITKLLEGNRNKPL